MTLVDYINQNYRVYKLSLLKIKCIIIAILLILFFREISLNDQELSAILTIGTLLKNMTKHHSEFHHTENSSVSY